MDAYQVLAERHDMGGSGRYRKILQALMTLEEARLVTLLPDSWDELARKSGSSVEDVKRHIEDLMVKGVIFPRNFRTHEGARFARSAMQLHDATLSGATIQTSLNELWDDFCNQEWYARVARDYEERPAPLERVLAAYKALPGGPGVTPFDDVREVIKTASPVAKVRCCCRTQMGKQGVIMDSCLQFGRAAEYAIERGSGRKLSYDETMKIIDQVEDDGEVHMWVNVRQAVSGAMCNCTNDACIIWIPLRRAGVWIGKRAAKSRFEASVRQEQCDGCQVCLDRCQFDAITMVSLPGSKRLKARVDPEKCWGCGLCVLTCAPSAIDFKLVRSLDHIPQ